VLFTDHGSIPYSNRADLLADLYLDFMPDFIGLQEAQGGIGAAIYEGIKERYERISQISGHTPVLYRKDIWRPVTDSEGATVKNAVHEANCWGFEWVMFERIDDPTVKVIVGNLHFPPSSYSTRRPAAMDHFNNEIKRLESEYKDIPIFVTGDYNTKVTGKRHTGLDDGWEEDIIVDTTLQSGGQLTEDTDDKNKTTIDHICVSSKLVEVVRHRGVSYETMKNSSDHRPYFVDIKLK
jgi:exonuclease III